MRTTRTKRTKTDLKFKFVLANPMTGKVKKSVFHPSSPFYKQIFCGMIEDYHSYIPNGMDFYIFVCPNHRPRLRK